MTEYHEEEGLFQRVIGAVEQAWLASAEASRCWDLEVKDPEEEELNPRRMVPSVKLSSGHSIPTVGLGVYKSAGEECYNAVRSALKLGYRHIDSAQIYKNENDVGRAVEDSGLSREEVFITTKLWKANWGFDQAKAAVKESLQKLRTSYVDLVLLHAPGDAATRAETWRALEECVDGGLVRSIGVSNFGIPHLEKLLTTAKIVPAVNQIELHPFLQWPEEVAYCKQKGIVLEAYSPLAKGHKLEDETVVDVAHKLGRTPAQVLIRWGLQHGYVSLPKSVSPERQGANLDVFSWSIPHEEMARLDALEEGLVTGWNPIRDDPV